jgi:hypothetical protein
MSTLPGTDPTAGPGPAPAPSGWGPGVPVPPPPGAARRLPPLQLPTGAPPAPPVAARRRGRRGWLVAGVACLVLAVLSGALTAAAYSDARGPRNLVRQYFAALAAGYASRALAFAAVPPKGPYLTASVLRQQLQTARLTDIRVGSVQVAGDTGRVQVGYRLRFPGTAPREIQDTVNLVRHAGTWRLDEVATSTTVEIGSSGSDRVTFAGGAVPTAAVLVFPGALPLRLDSPALRFDGGPSVRLADSGPTDVSISLTDTARARLDRSVGAALNACLTGRSADPNCPTAPDDRPIPDTLRGTGAVTGNALSEYLSGAGGGLIQVSGTVAVHGSWKDWDFNNQVVPKSGVAEVDVLATASLADLDSVYWSSR